MVLALKNLAIFISLLGAVWSHPARADKIPTVLYIISDVEEGKAISPDYIQDFKEVFKKTLPNHQLIVAKGMHFLPQMNRLEIENAIRRQLTPHHEITHLVIVDHGSLSKETFRFSTFGEVNENGVDKVFANTLGQIKNNLSPQLTLVLNSCGVFCGNKQVVEQRAQAIAEFFGIQDGTIYGTSNKFQYVLSPKFADTKIPKSMGIASLNVFISFGIPILIYHGMDVPTFLGVAAASPLVALSVTNAARIFDSWFKNGRNRGQLFQFAGGGLTGSTGVNEKKAFAQIYNLNLCHEELKQLTY